METSNLNVANGIANGTVASVRDIVLKKWHLTVCHRCWKRFFRPQRICLRHILCHFGILI